MKLRRLLPRTVPPLDTLESQHDHRNQEHDVDQREDQPSILIIDLITEGDPDQYVNIQFDSHRGNPPEDVERSRKGGNSRVERNRHGEDVPEDVEDAGYLGTLRFVALLTCQYRGKGNCSRLGAGVFALTSVQ